MQDHKENNTSKSLVSVVSKGLVRLEKSIGLTEKILKEQNDRLFILNWEIIFEHSDFFNQFFSTFYSFTEAQLIDFYGKLIIGSTYFNLKTKFGLIFNRNIAWTKKLKIIYYEEPKLLWAGGDGRDVYSFEIKFDKLPLDINEEIESIKSIYENHIINGYGYSEEDGYYDSLSDELDKLEKSFSNVLLRKDFSNEVILKVITNNDVYYFGNGIFCERLIKKIHNDINGFNIDVFYSNMNI